MSAAPSPTATPAAPRHNLPPAGSPLLGREADLARTGRALRAARLVTLTGPGGVGKTRLALAVAAALLGAFPDGAWLVELAPLAEPDLLPAAVAAALGLREEPGRALAETLATVLHGKRVLLLLDNCEHLCAACAALVGALMGAVPGLRVLATSRRPLGLVGERRLVVPPLALPTTAAAGWEAVAGAPAVALFVARAQAVAPSFALTAENAAAVAAICARLDGLPLAIELAAARATVRHPEALLAELRERLRVLAGGRRGLPDRQRTLRGLLDWGFTLLSPGEQALFARLSVFAGGWTAAAAQAVCVIGDDLPFAAAAGLAALAEQSLVQGPDAAGRYRCLETVREYAAYALERLQAEGDAAAVRARHLAYYLALAAAAEPQLTGPEQGAWLARLEAEHDNLRAALSWAREHEHEGERGLRLAGSLWRFWYMRGHFSEGRGWLEAALAAGGRADLRTRATALSGAGILATYQGDYARAAALHGDALALRRRLGDTPGIAASHTSLGNVVSMQGEYARAATLYEESLALRRQLGDTPGIAASLNNLGNVVSMQGEDARAAALYEESLALLRELGDKHGIAISLTGLGNVVSAQGEYARAAALYEESLALERELGHQHGIAISLNNLGDMAYRQGEYGRAVALLRESLQLSGAMRARQQVAEALEILTWVSAAREQPRAAARVGGVAEALREALGAPLPPDEQADHDQAVQVMQAALGEETFAAAWAVGKAMAWERAIALALEETDAAPPGP